MQKSIIAIAALALLYIPAVGAAEARSDHLRIAMGGLAFAHAAGSQLR